MPRASPHHSPQHAANLCCKREGGPGHVAERGSEGVSAGDFPHLFFTESEKYANEHTCSVENGGKCGKPLFALIAIVETTVNRVLSTQNRKLVKLVSHLRLYEIYLLLQSSDLGFYNFQPFIFVRKIQIRTRPTWAFINSPNARYPLPSAIYAIQVIEWDFNIHFHFSTVAFLFLFKFSPFSEQNVEKFEKRRNTLVD